MAYRSTARRYPSVAAQAIEHKRWDCTVTAAGTADDVATCLMQGARTLKITAAGTEGDVWTFAHQGRSVDYVVQMGDDASDVAAALRALIVDAWPAELKTSVSTDTIRMVVLDGSNEAPVLSNDGDGTATNVAGAKYTVVALDTATLVAAGLAAAIDAFPDLSATNVAGQVQATTASNLGSAPVYSSDGDTTFGAVAAHAAEDVVGYGRQEVRQIIP